jgi:hypothetical protein
MKHGDKAKGKASKASKTSDKKVSKAGGAKIKASEAKGGEAKGGEAKAGAKVEKSAAQASGKGSGKVVIKGAIAKAGSASRAPEGNGSRARPETGDASFGNPIIAAAFKRAAKKYSNAFRRLTD